MVILISSMVIGWIRVFQLIRSTVNQAIITVSFNEIVVCAIVFPDINNNANIAGTLNSHAIILLDHCLPSLIFCLNAVTIRGLLSGVS